MKKQILKFFICGFLLIGLVGIIHAQSYEQLEKVVASDAAATDYFGIAVSISGNKAIVGAYGNDDAGSSSGSAYIYEWNGTTWAQTAKLTADDAVANTYFGNAVAISGDRAVVSAYTDTFGQGAVYVYDWNGSSWDETKLTASDAAGSDNFGWSVAIDGDKIVVGAIGDNDTANGSGSAYIYEWNGVDTWIETKLNASDAAGADQFGRSVSVSGDKVIVGAFGNDDAGSYSGSAYIYEWNGVDTWVETKIVASDAIAGAYFGNSVAISGDKAVVGAFYDDDGAGTAGSVYIYEWSGSEWVETKITSSDALTGDQFGYSVSIDGSTMVVGAMGDDDAGGGSGSAYVYEWNGSAWVEMKIVSEDAVSGDQFGVWVSISGGKVFVGAFTDDDAGTSSGSAYFFVSSLGPDNFCSAGDIATLTNPLAGQIYWDWDGNSPYLANSGGTAVVAIIPPAETVLTTAEITTLDGSAEPGMVYFDEETGELFISDSGGNLQDPATITSNAVADTSAVEASAVAGEVYFDTTTGEVFYCEVDGTLDTPSDPSSSCLTQ